MHIVDTGMDEQPIGVKTLSIVVAGLGCCLVLLSGCVTKQALILGGRAGPTIHLREVKHGLSLGPCGFGLQHYDWDVAFQLAPWREAYSIDARTPVELAGISAQFRGGSIRFSKDRKVVDVSLLVRNGSLAPWEHNGQYSSQWFSRDEISLVPAATRALP
jgi:hypothetical protein